MTQQFVSTFRLSTLGAAALVGALALQGCQTAETQLPTAKNEMWSSKEQSVVMGSVGGARLNIPEGIGELTDTGLHDAAVEMLREAAESEYPLLRANAIEGLRHEPTIVEPLAIASLSDENRGVRFVAAMTIGNLQLKQSSYLLEPLLLDPSDSVRAAAMYGLKRCGHTVDLNPLGRMLMSDDPEVKSNAALVLGELGEKSASPMIRRAVGKNLATTSPIRRRIVELQLAEAMVKLGKTNELEGIRAALFTTAEQGEITALACLICGRLKDSAAVQTLLSLATRTGPGEHPAEVRMAAAMAVAQIDVTSAPVEVPMNFANNDRSELRAQSAMTLGKIPHPAVVGQLRQLLSDPDPLVQVSAAAAILELEAR